MHLHPHILAGLRKFDMDLVHPDEMAVILEICYDVCAERGKIRHCEFFSEVVWRSKSHKLTANLSKTKLRGCLATLWNTGCLKKVVYGGRTYILCMYGTVDELFDAFNKGVQRVLPPPGIGCYFNVDTTDTKKLLLGF